MEPWAQLSPPRMRRSEQVDLQGLFVPPSSGDGMAQVGCVDGIPAEDKAVISLPHFLGLLRDQDIWQEWGIYRLSRWPGVENRANQAGQRQTGRARRAEPGEENGMKLKALGLYKWILLKWKFPPIPEMEPSSMARSGEGCSNWGHRLGQKPQASPSLPQHPPSSSPPRQVLQGPEESSHLLEAFTLFP